MCLQFEKLIIQKNLDNYNIRKYNVNNSCFLKFLISIAKFFILLMHLEIYNRQTVEMISVDSLSLSTIRKNDKNYPLNFNDTVKIKRKTFWVVRYITIADSKLIYYFQKGDLKPRGVIHLHEAIVKENFEGKNELIQLKVLSQDLCILIQISEKKQREWFLKCLKQNMKKNLQTKSNHNDSQYEQSQQQFQTLKNQKNNHEEQEILKYPELPQAYKQITKLNYKRISIQKNCIKYMKQQQKQQPHLFSIILQLLKELIDQLQAIFLMCLVIIILVLIFIFPLCLLPLIVLMIVKVKQKFQIFYKVSKQKSNFTKTQYLIRQNKNAILQIILEKRDELYEDINIKNQSDQIFELDVSHDLFQWENKLYIAQCLHQKLYYLWEIEGIQNPVNQSIITLHNHSNYKEINLYLLDFILLRKRMHIKNMKLNNFAPEANRLEQFFSQNIKTNTNNNINQDNISKLNSKIISKISKTSQQFNQSVNGFQKNQIPKQYLSEIKASREKFIKNLQNQWDILQIKNNCRMFTKQYDEILGIKGEAIVKGNLEEIVQYLYDPLRRGDYDKMYDKAIILQKFENCAIICQRFNGMFPVDGRDFVLITMKQQTENGYLIHAKSIKYQYKGQPKTVRAQLISGGFQIKNVGEQNIKITYIAQSDPKGNIPAMIKRQASKLQVGLIVKLSQIITKKKHKQKLE